MYDFRYRKDHASNNSYLTPMTEGRVNQDTLKSSPSLHEVVTTRQDPQTRYGLCMYGEYLDVLGNWLCSVCYKWSHIELVFYCLVLYSFYESVSTQFFEFFNFKEYEYFNVKTKNGQKLLEILIKLMKCNDEQLNSTAATLLFNIYRVRGGAYQLLITVFIIIERGSDVVMC